MDINIAKRDTLYSIDAIDFLLSYFLLFFFFLSFLFSLTEPTFFFTLFSFFAKNFLFVNSSNLRYTFQRILIDLWIIFRPRLIVIAEQRDAVRQIDSSNKFHNARTGPRYAGRFIHFFFRGRGTWKEFSTFAVHVLYSGRRCADSLDPSDRFVKTRTRRVLQPALVSPLFM